MGVASPAHRDASPDPRIWTLLPIHPRVGVHVLAVRRARLPHSMESHIRYTDISDCKFNAYEVSVDSIFGEIHRIRSLDFCTEDDLRRTWLETREAKPTPHLQTLIVKHSSGPMLSGYPSRRQLEPFLAANVTGELAPALTRLETQRFGFRLSSLKLTTLRHLTLSQAMDFPRSGVCEFLETVAHMPLLESLVVRQAISPVQTPPPAPPHAQRTLFLRHLRSLVLEEDGRVCAAVLKRMELSALSQLSVQFRNCHNIHTRHDVVTCVDQLMARFPPVRNVRGLRLVHTAHVASHKKYGYRGTNAPRTASSLARPTSTTAVHP
ncbi:uncharacterized protein C8Q71DRAFT_350814 [Rhodofomes roseus]|uniref:Uncharacterized protein n=1 Tax=Rhodofomes roseus TaxID=34475 RepID=A0ABQ8KUT1_9APHY|nr:uncharacterized protein C8Q71DRAFT_350814 [Rhodofomes roseus]KAH9841841.1 hypothetical protein C8Q71DRAFT_350814 [Rhodofomes roseus]